jgi:hypothetical protein
MSNFRAIATVTAAITDILTGVRNDVESAEITTKPPSALESPEKDGLNLFLYYVTPNNGYENLDLPTRNLSGQIIATPQLALNLHYLLTAYALNNDDLKAQLILASAMRILYENPVLTREMIRKIVSQPDTMITGSDLADQVELVKLSHQSLSLEEITKLWTSFFQNANYRISVTYQATVVLLSSKKEARPILPVRDRLVYVAPFRQPIIDKVEPQILERTSDAKITIKGRNLKADDRVVVQFNGGEPQPPDGDDVVEDNQIVIAVPSDLSAGIKSVQVIHKMELGLPKIPHLGYESNVVSFVLAPKITNISPTELARGTDLVLDFEPAISPRQKASLLIGDYTLSVTRDPAVSIPVKTLSVKIPEDFPIDEYLLRLRVNGAESFLEVDPTDNTFVGPKITIKEV